MKYLIIISSFYLLMAQCNDQKPEIKSCDTEARVMKLDLDGCDLILQLDNGQRLLPVEVVPPIIQRCSTTKSIFELI